MFRNFCLVGFSMAFASTTVATTLGAEVNRSSQASSQALTADGPYQNKDFGWDLSYTHTTTQATVTDTTHDLILGSGWATKAFSANLDLNYSSTPEENLASYGPTLSFSYTHFFGAVPNADAAKFEAFRTSLKTVLELSTLNYEETFSVGGGGRRKGALVRPTTGNNTIQQKSVMLGLRWKPQSWLQLKAGETKYSYSKDVNQFLQYIESPAVTQVSSGMNNALAGFYDSTRKLEIDFYFLEDWELDLSQAQSRVLSDSSLTTVSAVSAGVNLGENWYTAVGVKNVTSSSPGTSDVATVTGRVSYYF